MCICVFRDSRSTVAIVLGGFAGEAIFPISVGQIIAITGPNAFIWYVLVATVALLFCYTFLHGLLSIHKNYENDLPRDVESGSGIVRIRDIIASFYPLSTVDRIRLRARSHLGNFSQAADCEEVSDHGVEMPSIIPDVFGVAKKAGHENGNSNKLL